MASHDPTVERRARQAVWDVLVRRQLGAGRKRVHLVSYPRSGSTLLRSYFAILQGCPQLSVYEGDVVPAENAALTSALDGIAIVKSHRTTADDGPTIYLIRDGRNATLSFLYMAFLFGGHCFSALADVYDGIRHLDAAEGSWVNHVAAGLTQAQTRSTLFVRYEDLTSDPAAALAAIARFLNRELPVDLLGECVRRQKASDAYASNPYNGYLHEPTRDSIYDILKRFRREDYWRRILDGRSRRYFHDSGATALLMRFGYERSADWWMERPAPHRGR
jgi:hypothetical protein